MYMAAVMQTSLFTVWENYGTWNETFGVYSYINKSEIQTRRHDFQATPMKVAFYIEFEETWNHLEDFRLNNANLSEINLTDN